MRKIGGLGRILFDREIPLTDGQTLHLRITPEAVPHVKVMDETGKEVIAVGMFVPLNVGDYNDPRGAGSSDLRSTKQVETKARIEIVPR